MKYRLLCTCIVLSVLSASSAISIRISPQTISDADLRQRMEHNVTALMNEIDAAGRLSRQLNISSLDMESGARSRLTALWGNIHFICEKPTILSPCLKDVNGYQLRVIPITVKPIHDSFKQSLNRELTISFSKTGTITGVRPAMESHENVRSVLGNGGAVTDLAQRREILKFIEDYLSFYIEKDLRSLDMIFSEGSLILADSGLNVLENDYSEYRHTDKIVYKKHDNRQYISNLNKIFQRSKNLNVELDTIIVERHTSRPNIYGLTMHQKLSASTYSDSGWMFMLWDFNEPATPQIRMRSWQSGDLITTDEVLTLDNICLP